MTCFPFKWFKNADSAGINAGIFIKSEGLFYYYYIISFLDLFLQYVRKYPELKSQHMHEIFVPVLAEIKVSCCLKQGLLVQSNNEEKKVKGGKYCLNFCVWAGGTVQLPPGEKVSRSIKMRGGLRGAEGVQVSEGIIYERG